MSEYKLVPVEPTQEMVEAAADAYMPFGDMELALRMAILAAPDVEGEPVGRVKTVGGYPDESEHTIEWLCKYKDLKDGDPLYAAPQPAPDVAGLTEALRQYQHNDGSGLVFGYDKLLVDQYVAQLVEAPQPVEHQPDASGLVATLKSIEEWVMRYADPKHPVATVARKALADYHKQGGEV